jgi:hypothetical protein
MPEQPDLASRRPKRAKKKHSWFHHVFRRQLPLETETTVFILVNMMDFFVTFWMLATQQFHESNPIARWFLEGWGPVKGMLMFKLALVTLVCLIAQIVYLRRPEVARKLLVFGTVVVFGVVVYSVTLHQRHGGHVPTDNDSHLFDPGFD